MTGKEHKTVAEIYRQYGMVTVYFTKEITRGCLKGFRFIESIAYPTQKLCADFIKHGRKGFKDWKIVDASFQNYKRG